ncbi:DUF3488 and transglutaminase-like domain-containing protein [Microbacterium paludicola]|uniref:transglutaminase family protein n=1 Tax=Microbacterium paludicola TaxID=300019 RepID=UPI0011A74A9C|nr:DUF3488 and transglutaminase-like domain-containing protein [Microbacterium paludicola]
MFRAEPKAAIPPAVAYAQRLRRRDRTLAAALLSLCAGLVMLWPFTSVIAAGPWSLLSITLIVVVVLSGMLARLVRRGRHADGVLPFFVQLVVAVLAITVLLLPQGALLGVVPTGTTVDLLSRLAADAVQQVQFGTAPLVDTPALRTVLSIGFAAVAILLDQLITARLALPAILVVAVVGALPMIITLGDANVPWFVLLALLSLFLLRHSIRHGDRLPQRASTGLSVGVGAAAIAAALALTPVLPLSTTWLGPGASTQLDPSLRLGEDLRRPTPFTVITLATDAPTAPYLRIATLSSFDGETWSPDKSSLQPIADGFGDPDWGDIDTDEMRTSIRINGISGSWLPVPYAATRVVGVSSGWEAMPFNRTVTSDDLDAADEDYTVTFEVVQPTREQVQATTATPGISPNVSDLVTETALDVTAEATSDYDRLIAMQDWFRSQFEYSLDAPVAGDFDGTGIEAVEEFLQVRSGYCIHFAGAFALMAQSLDMQVRIVVGYLPGSLTDERRGDESIYTVSSDQMHAWPEVHFDGIGWVRFEPTASLGVPTDYLPATTEGGTTTDPNAPEPSAAPSTAPTRDPGLEEEQLGGTTAPDETLRRLDPTPVVLVGAGVLVVLLLPMLIRQGVRAGRMMRARRGDAAAAWREIRATLTDLHLPVSDADTPRLRGAHLVERGAPPDEVRRLVDAVERVSFARSDDGIGDLARELAHVTAALPRAVDVRGRLAALLLPRSLFVSERSRDLVE